MEAFKKILRTPSAFVLFLIAVVSLIGVIIKSETDKTIARIPINATSTAETKLTQLASTLLSTSTLPIATPIIIIPTSTLEPCIENDFTDENKTKFSKSQI